MKLRSIYTLILLFSAFSYVSSQTISKKFDKLVFLYIDEKYEKCAKLGLNYTEDDQLRRDPIPYLYVSMSFFEIAKTQSLSEKYPDAFKNSLKYAYKYRKKDKDEIYVQKYHGFLVALKDSANRLAQYYIQQESYRKAASTYKYAVRFAPDDPLIQVLQGLAEIKARNVGEGERNLNLGMERIDENYLPDKELLWVASSAMTEYAAYMDSKGDYSGKRKGQKLAEKFKKYSPEEIERLKKLEQERNKPKKEVKKFETDKQTVENQKPKILGTTESNQGNEGAKGAKKELERIEQEEKNNKKSKREVKTFQSDD